MIAYYNNITLGENLDFVPIDTFPTECTVIIKNNKFYKSYYSQYTFDNKYNVDELIYSLTLANKFIFNKTNDSLPTELVKSLPTELVDSKTGMTRYIFWPNNMVERIFEEEIDEASAKSFLISNNKKIENLSVSSLL